MCSPIEIACCVVSCRGYLNTKKVMADSSVRLRQCIFKMSEVIHLNICLFSQLYTTVNIFSQTYFKSTSLLVIPYGLFSI